MASTLPLGDPADEPLPRVLHAATLSDWFVVGGVWAGFAVASATGFLGRVDGTPTPWWLVLLGYLLDALVWVGLMPPLFAVLDRVRWARGRRLAAVAAWLLIAVAASGLHALFAWPTVLFAVDAVGLAPVADRSPVLQWWTFARGDLSNYWVGFGTYLVLQRVLRDRCRQERAARLEVLLAEARLQALARQLEPHFLFNTLNGIAALVRDDPRTAEAMLVRLSDLLRLTLESGDSGELALGEELERLELYLAIQRMRFGARLTVRLTVAPETLSARVPSLLLQPLVENALVHGIGPRPGPGTLDIVARVRDGALELVVSDDGRGLPPDLAERERRGVGTTRARLAAMFPGAHRFDLRSGPVAGTTVTIVLPFEPPRRRLTLETTLGIADVAHAAG